MSLAGVQQRQQFINSDQGCLITSVDTAFFVKVNHVCEKLASPVHSVKSVRGNAAYRAQSQRQWLDKLPDELKKRNASLPVLRPRADVTHF